ncbi:hypothetical protein BCR43DRAFT_516978 [Syncephalastrum racemosum]|uniref:Uncharacterized protein n=1 Tax=Syncephalastrum racemosum TaxID=13706 RepID=A0A1X2H6E4_SYNRA|nr:hypothetical protein BCR43DRAFT_516978 [Syncephalastrum racemosum]
MTQDIVNEPQDVSARHSDLAKSDAIQEPDKKLKKMKAKAARLTPPQNEAEIRCLRKEDRAVSPSAGTFKEKVRQMSTAKPSSKSQQQTQPTQSKEGKAYSRRHRLLMVKGRYADMEQHPRWSSLARSIPQTGRNLNWETLHKLIVDCFDPRWPKARTQAFKQVGYEMAIDVCYDIQQDRKGAEGAWTTLPKRLRLDAIQRFEDLCADHFPLELFRDAWAAKHILAYTWNNMRPKKDAISASDYENNKEGSSVRRMVISHNAPSPLSPPTSLRRAHDVSSIVVAPSPWTRLSSFPLPPLLYRDTACKSLIRFSDSGKIDLNRIWHSHNQ